MRILKNIQGIPCDKVDRASSASAGLSLLGGLLAAALPGTRGPGRPSSWQWWPWGPSLADSLAALAVTGLVSGPELQAQTAPPPLPHPDLCVRIQQPC